MTDLGGNSDFGEAGNVLRHDFEVAARRLIAAWAVNPSLVQVLKYALDLVPSPELLGVVTEALAEKIVHPANKYEYFVALYVLAELFRAGATETGWRTSNDTEFSVGDLHEYRENLATLAQTVLEGPVVPWYVQQQAALLLASVGQVCDSLPRVPELKMHNSLHAFLQGRSEQGLLPPNDEIAVSLIGHQLVGDERHYAKWLRQFAIGKPREAIAYAFELIGQTNAPLFNAVTVRGAAGKAAKSGFIASYLAQYIDGRWESNSSALPVNEWVSLAKLITHRLSPFSQENALLQLAFVLVQLVEEAPSSMEQLTPLTIELKCADWTRLANPGIRTLKARFNAELSGKDPRYRTPDWCTKESAWMYALGRLLRAAATGELDFTARQWLLREDVGWYRGIQSTWHKRRMGMLHTAVALRGTSSAITPWFSELLLRLLRWPGISVEAGLIQEFASLKTPKEFEALVVSRLNYQERLYGKSSDLPLYVYPVEWQLKDSRHLRVALVQGLMPCTKDFAGGLASLSVPGFRARHREHTAALLNLAYDKIQAREAVLGDSVKPKVDLVILPEYSVHVDDQDLLRAFSDATGAMVFYGLIGAVEPGGSSPINTARWLVPQVKHGKRSWVSVDQGKWHVTEEEVGLGVKQWRPHQVIIELQHASNPGFRLSGAICYDATDIALAADLRDVSHLFVVSAMNKDVKTFDSMVAALRYHMYQHVVIANAGEFGGSTAQAPYDKEHKRLIAHVHGGHQIAVNIFDIDTDHFGPRLAAIPNAATPDDMRIGKTPPAGLRRVPV
jgi:hypothetical protein